MERRKKDYFLFAPTNKDYYARIALTDYGFGIVKGKRVNRDDIDDKTFAITVADNEENIIIVAWIDNKLTQVEFKAEKLAQPVGLSEHAKFVTIYQDTKYGRRFWITPVEESYMECPPHIFGAYKAAKLLVEQNGGIYEAAIFTCVDEPEKKDVYIDITVNADINI